MARISMALALVAMIAFAGGIKNYCSASMSVGSGSLLNCVVCGSFVQVLPMHSSKAGQILQREFMVNAL